MNHGILFKISIFSDTDVQVYYKPAYLFSNLYGFYSCKMNCLPRIELMIEPCKTENNRFIHVPVTAVQL